jgi:hypothetical protein
MARHDVGGQGDGFAQLLRCAVGAEARTDLAELGTDGAHRGERCRRRLRDETDVPVTIGGPANGGTDLVTNWDGAPIFVDGNGTVVNDRTGSVVIDPGEEIISAYRIDVSDGSQGTTGTLRYTAVATVQ